MIAREGFERASLRAITAEAQVPLSTLHYAFASREALIQALIEQTLSQEQLTGVEVVAHAHPGASLEELIGATLRRYVGSLRERPHQEQAMLELTIHALRAETSQAQKQYLAYYANAEAALRLAAAVTDRSWSVPVPLVARLVTTITDGLTTTWLATRDTQSAFQICDSAAVMLAGLALPASATEEGVSSCSSSSKTAH